MHYRFFLLALAFLANSSSFFAQYGYWQQHVVYQMDIDVDVEKNQYKGSQRLVYTNHSPDTLQRIFYHLYLNAFQPGSMMDTRSLLISDPDRRVGDRISKLQPDEIGYQKVNSLTQDNLPVVYKTVGTILEVELAKPLLPNAKTELVMQWDAQVPLQVRRNGRDSEEGIRLSMAQWYPKLAEYDDQGWHANPYVGREFHGVWGDFDVRISIDSDYVVGGTGYLQNPEEIGHGYAEDPKKRKKKVTYHFKAPNVHDFFWGADPDYTHTSFKRADGMVMHFFYQENERTKDNWEALPKIMDEAFNYINAHYGQYMYDQYSFVQGGDGGMEYPMGTLITGERNINSLVGVSVHELMHSWYQMMMATNEALYAWMDEGFTSWASAEVMNHLKSKNLIPGDPTDNPHAGSYRSLNGFRQSGLQEPISTHADHFDTNAAYSVAAYVNGAVFLEQLRYIIGEEAFAATLLRYYHTWKGKHPTPNAFIRVAEKEANMELDWYKEYWVYTTKVADYAVASVRERDGKSAVISLEKIGQMPMPQELTVTLKNGEQMMYYIPMVIMRGEKPQPSYATTWTVLPDWPWTKPNYEVELSVPLDQIERVQLDARGRMFDSNPDNNSYPRE